ncbi:MAG: hypothetical protein K6G40_04330 [Eubacterium sp.]|nr:hypothetical protein [Eubacterium sp.]
MNILNEKLLQRKIDKYKRNYDEVLEEYDFGDFVQITGIDEGGMSVVRIYKNMKSDLLKGGIIDSIVNVSPEAY